MKFFSSTTRQRIPSSEEEAAEAEREAVVELEQKRSRRVGLAFFELKILCTRIMVAAMGCFFNCFGVNKDSSPSSGSNLEDSSSSATTPAVKVGSVTRNRSPLSSLLLAEEDKDGTPCKLKEEQELGTPKPEIGLNLKELKDEAKFLKACGTLPETPVEIRQASEKWKDLSAQKGDHEHSKFRSWLTNTSAEKLNLEMNSDQPLTPTKHCERWMKLSDSLDHTPSSCLTEGLNAGRVSNSSVEGNETKNAGSVELIASPSHSLTGSSVPKDITPIIIGKNKSVRFDCDSDTSSVTTKSCPSETSSQSLKQSGSSSNLSIAKFSPYPTPLKLSDEMQTPGTVFPAYLDVMGQGKNTRIRSQYVYSVLNPAENMSQWKDLKNEDANDYQSSHSRQSCQEIDQETSASEVGTGRTSVGQELKVEASLSSWLRATFPNPDGPVVNNGSSTSEKSQRGRTPGDRPILGMVAAHWNDDEHQVSPKWWDGNGIPNSTNKYKEDQKVSWHATPFEERLEKALSEETFNLQRNQTSGTPPPDFNETEEDDTALSQLQPSNHFKSVVSF
ncbi:protein JASON-like isoform X1 [Coffea eugenioides]|uniref:protein JASON-like isoform X1 n=1 Tax=Coffea eugenioides TaxID=49369 RepID=UPI000F6151F8|nr:protein JASON-like isoform X1 [Coffea eugenioides]